MTNYCHSLGFVQDVLDIELRLELFVNECFFGPFGYLNDNPEDPFDCWRRRYYPNIPVWSTSFMDEWDRRSEYKGLEWKCNYEPEEGEEIDNAGLGPYQNYDGEEEPQNFDSGDISEPDLAGNDMDTSTNSDE